MLVSYDWYIHGEFRSDRSFELKIVFRTHGVGENCDTLRTKVKLCIVHKIAYGRVDCVGICITAIVHKENSNC